MAELRLPPPPRFPGRAALLTALALTGLSVAMFSAGGVARAESPGDSSPQSGAAVDKENWPETEEVLTDGVVTLEIVNRPVGDNVVTITPEDDGITITGADGEDARSQAPLWPDHPGKGDADADPGAQTVGEAIGDGRHLVVLNRPATRKSDGEAHARQWDAWQTTYLELIASGEPFVECETGLSAPEVEQCWVTHPVPVPATEPAQAGEDGAQETDPAAVAQSLMERWPGLNFQWTDPGQAGGADSAEDANPLLTTGQDPDDGAAIVVVNIPRETDDAEQREENFDLEDKTLDALDAAGEPYVVCFPEQTYFSQLSGQMETLPAFCNIVDPSAYASP